MGQVECGLLELVLIHISFLFNDINLMVTSSISTNSTPALSESDVLELSDCKMTEKSAKLISYECQSTIIICRIGVLRSTNYFQILQTKTRILMNILVLGLLSRFISPWKPHAAAGLQSVVVFF